LDDSGQPFGWSAPLTVPLTCVNQFHDGTNEKLYGVYEGGNRYRIEFVDFGPPAPPTGR
jgi:hypothetical protein